jgi:hypothetical protein
METGPPHRARGWLLLAAAALTLVAPATASAERRPTMREARAAARALVVKHPSYRSIESNAPLVTHACRRLRRTVRCSLYRWAPDPCALDGRDGPCVQVLTRRTWTVAVTRRRGRTAARVLRIAETSTPPSQRESERSSS